MRAWFLAIALVNIPGVLQADETSEILAKQKKAAQDIIKKLGAPQATLLETEHLFIITTMPENRQKAFADTMEKYYGFTLKALKFEQGDTPPKGKLALYAFPERPRYISFFRLQERTVERGETTFSEPREDIPYVAVTLPLGETKGNLDPDASAAVASALLRCKAGPAMLPAWLQQGFSKAIQMRVEPKVYEKNRLAIRKLFAAFGKSTPGKDPKNPMGPGLKDVYSPDDTPQRQLLSTSLVEYLVFGPEAAKFSRILAAFRPSDDVPNPTFENAMKSAEMTAEGLEKAWRRFALLGK